MVSCRFYVGLLVYIILSYLVTCSTGVSFFVHLKHLLQLFRPQVYLER